MGADKGTLRRQLRGPSQRPCPSTGILMNWRAVLSAQLRSFNVTLQRVASLRTYANWVSQWHYLCGISYILKKRKATSPRFILLINLKPSIEL